MATSLINWVEWTDEAFQKAKNENKLILLDISAVWCHWCHRLDQDTYSVPEIAQYIESHFVPIRVDTDKRPDINRRYNMGGWPTTAFLTPDGRVIGGGTYFPPDQMRKVLRDIDAVWQKTKSGEYAEVTHLEPESIPIGNISASFVDEVLGEIANSFDPIYGGFGSQPKFPSTDALELALLKYHYAGNHEILRIATLTLQNAGKGGIYDREMGGFFRYSTVRDWSIPHYEKMGEDNAKWLSLYVHACQVTGEQFYANIAQGIVEYVRTWLSDATNGGFYGSQDADEEYYKLTKTERLKTKAPYIDKHIYTNWNALMISSFIEASYALGDTSLREFALKSLGRLIILNDAEDKGMYHYHDGQPHLINQLIDQMQTIRTLCHAYETTGDINYLTRAEKLTETTSKLYDKEHGAFFDTTTDPNAPGFLSKPAKPLDENSVAARALVKLFHLTEKDRYRMMAEETLNRFTEVFPQFGYMAADYALAVDAFLSEPTMIRIIGSLDKPQTIALLTEAHKIYEPRRTIQLLDPNRDSERISKLGYAHIDQPIAYVCLGKLCTAPIAEPRNLSSELARLVKAQLKR